MEMNNNLAAVIIGDLNSKFDGSVSYAGYDYRYHINALRGIYYKFLNQNYNMGKIDLFDDVEGCFTTMDNGHIFIKNASIEDHRIFFIYVPKEFTVKQLQSLKLIIPQLINSEVYICSMDNEFINYELVENIEKKFTL